MYSRHGIVLAGDWPELFSNAVLEPTVRICSADKIRIGDGTYIGDGAILYGYKFSYQSIQIGERCWIGCDSVLHGAGGLVIGDRVGIGPGVKILTSAHNIDGPGHILDRPLVFNGVTIEDGADIGAGACILPGVRIGRGAQIGMGAVVTHNVPRNEVWAGNPARLIRQRVIHKEELLAAHG